MSQSPEINGITLLELSDFIRSDNSGLSGATIDARRKALGSLREFLASAQRSDFIATTVEIADWYADMLFRGLSTKTASYYLDTLASVYSSIARKGFSVDTGGFKTVKQRIRQLSPSSLSNIITEAHTERLRSVAASAHRLKGREQLAADLMLISILNGCMPLQDVAMLRVDELDSLDPDSAEIARRHIEPRRRYVFPLGQSSTTPRQVGLTAETLVGEFMLSRNLTPALPASQAIMALWAHTAMSCGYTASEILSSLRSIPLMMPYLAVGRGFAPDSYDSSDSFDGGNDTTFDVADAIIANQPRWFAMRLRPGASFDRLQNRLQTVDSELRPELFYPCREIARRTGRRLTYRQQPFIADVVFFRIRPTDVATLFRHIYDLAWCYRTSPGINGRYAIIPAVQMHLFQQAIGQFTEAYTVAPAGTLPLRPGDHVEILGGILAGTDATLSSVTALPATPDGSTIYRILFPDARGIEWRVDIDSRLLRRTS